MGRILIAASPIPGHVMPLLRVGGDLCARGHDVTVLTGGEYRRAVSEDRLQLVALPQGARPRRASARDHWAPPLLSRWRLGRADMVSVFIAPLAAQFYALRDVLRANHFDMVLCDIAFTGVLPILLGGNPRPAVFACGVGPLTLSSTDVPPFGMGWAPKVGRDYRAMTRVVHEGLMGDVQRRLNQTLAALDAPRSPAFLTDWPVLADRLLQFTIPAMEYPRSDLPAHVTFTGPVVAQTLRPAKQAPRCNARHVVHVTQGTWDNHDLDELLTPTLDGLAGCNDMHVVATTGNRGDVGLSRQLPSNAVVTDFVSYSALLPTVDVMVTNGGYGGVHHALLHGIPLVVAGATADKPEIAARVAYAGAGVNLGVKRPTPAAVAHAVQHVLRTPRYRQMARALGEDMRRYNAFGLIADAVSGVASTHAVPE